MKMKNTCIILILFLAVGCAKKEEPKPGKDWAQKELSKAEQIVVGPKVKTKAAPSLKVSQVQGEVELSNDKINFQAPARKGMTLSEGSRIKTRTESQIDLETTDKNFKSRMKSNTDAISGSFAFRDKDSQGEIDIDLGTIYIEVAKNHYSQFKVRTPSADISVTGTAFCVEVYGEEKNTWVGVVEGEVAVWNRITNQETTLYSGEAAELNALDGRTEVMYLTDEEAVMMRKELRRIGSGYPEELKPRVELLLPKNKNRLYTFLNSTALATNGKEPLRIHRLLMGALKLLEDGVVEEEKKFLLASIQKLESALLFYNESTYAPQLLMFIGVYYRNLEEYQKAIDSFDAVIRLYPDCEWVSLAYAAIGQTYEDMKEWDKAEKAYRTILEDYSDSLEVEPAADGLDRVRNRSYE